MRKDAEKRAVAFLKEVFLGATITPRRPFKIQPMMARYGVGRLWLPVLLKTNVIRKANNKRGFYDLLDNEESIKSLLLAYQKAEAEASRNRKILNVLFETVHGENIYPSSVVGVSQMTDNAKATIELQRRVDVLIVTIKQKNDQIADLNKIVSDFKRVIAAKEKVIAELNANFNAKAEGQPKFKIGDTLWFIRDNRISSGLVTGIKKYGATFKYDITSDGNYFEFLETGQPPHHQGRNFVFASKDDLIDDLRNG